MTDVYDQDSDPSEQPVAKPQARATHVNISHGILAAGTITVLLVGIAFGWAMRGQPTPPTTASPCADTSAAAEKYVRAAQQSRTGSDDEQRNKRLLFLVVTQNANCFPAELRASAQEALSRM
ncbi:hypothetical protein ACFC1T_16990 [Kitasatospora sp. NPDC056076]|uniref:hypothetical protein n=1 Tax=Kitasatospora sp. NPDC056076 TaxID=3345703 RepID=UPI0035E05EE1